MSNPLYTFCPRCGHKLSWRREFRTATHEPLRPVCNHCGFVHYEKSAPTASALIVNTKNEVLLAKRAWPPAKGSWDCIGGFLEAGEHPLEGLQREIKEEIGVTLNVKELIGVWMDRYYHNKHWRWTLNFYYRATIAKGKPKASDDVAAIKWFPINRLPKNISGKANRAALRALQKYSKNR